MMSSKVYKDICTVTSALIQHIITQKNMHSSRSSSKSDTAMKTAELVINWWAKTNIATKSKHSLKKMIQKLDEEWCYLNKKRAMTTPVHVEKRVPFKEKMSQTFWAVSPEFESMLAGSSERSKSEDYQFLLNMKIDRVGGLGCTDSSLKKRLKSLRNILFLVHIPTSFCTNISHWCLIFNIILVQITHILHHSTSRLKRAEKGIKRPLSECVSDCYPLQYEAVSDKDTEEEEEEEEKEEEEFTPRKPKRDKSLIKELALVADKYQLSHRLIQAYDNHSLLLPDPLLLKMFLL